MIFAEITIRVGNFILVKVAEQFELTSFTSAPTLTTFLAPAVHR